MTDTQNLIGVCGVGNMGLNHLKVYDRNNNVEVASMYDPESLVHCDYDLFLNSCQNLDGVSICAPSDKHAEIALDILKHNPKIKLLIEKPIDLNLNAAKSLLPYKDNIFVGHVERYNPVVLKLKEEIKDKQILK
ncbi:hypothetical protein CL634_07395, partial [bacterium]|nr:hypothetical protein [bacterium]